MYKWTLHYPKGEMGELMPPAVGYALHSVVVLTATTILAIWQQEGLLETEWGGCATVSYSNIPELAGTA